MSAPASAPTAAPAPSPSRTLRGLFLTLFLRGRSPRGLKAEKAPGSIASLLRITLVFYALFGLFAIGFRGQPVFVLSTYLHAMTFAFIGMFIAASSGEVLFNREEGDILLHRPIAPRTLLWAKVTVLLQVSLWLATAFNLVGFLMGVAAPDGGWRYLPVHAGSTLVLALFCTGSVVLLYQLCLRWFGRERLDSLMTTAQVLVAITFMLGAQVMPRLWRPIGSSLHVVIDAWWMVLLPPAWFAGIDDALAGSGAAGSWRMAVIGVAATAVVIWLAFGRLSGEYQAGLQALQDTTSTRRPRRAHARRWIDVLVHAPPLSWILRDAVARASFLLTAAYLVRDRDVKLRVYPALAPMLIVPILPIIRDSDGMTGLSAAGIAFAGAYLGLVPYYGVNLLRHSQQWQSADVFRVAPLRGPAELSHGVSGAVLVLLTLPLLIAFGAIATFASGDSSLLPLLLPGTITLPVYALAANLRDPAVPLSQAPDTSSSAGRFLGMFGIMIMSGIVTGLSVLAWRGAWFVWFLAGEAVVVGLLCARMHAIIEPARWKSME